MTCERVQENIILAQYGELPDEAAVRLEAHLAGCEDCRREWTALTILHDELALDPVREIDPNMLTSARMRLDDALDAMPPRPMLQRFVMNFFRWQGFVKGAPALATLLLGVGFLGGNMVTRYQAAHEPQLPRPVILSSGTQGAIASVSGIKETPNSDLVTVSYNRLQPESVQGTLDDPQIRQLLMLGTKLATDNKVHLDSVALLSNECLVGHQCDGVAAGGDGSADIRGTLLTSLRTDSDAGVRLKALEGLQPYVTSDDRVRDAVTQSLLHDASAQVRGTAVSLLTPVRADTTVRQALRTVSTQDVNPAVRNASFQASQVDSDVQ